MLYGFLTVSLGEFLRSIGEIVSSPRGSLVRLEATCPVIPKTGAEKLRKAHQMIHLEGLGLGNGHWKELAHGKLMIGN